MKKGQIETGELIMVIIVVTILLIAGLVGYGLFKTEDIQETAREFQSLSAIDLAQEAYSLPEVSCSYSRETPEECVDYYRLNIMEAKMENAGPNDQLYRRWRSKFGGAVITIEQVYPNENSWTIYNVTPEQTTAQIPLRLPVFIYNPHMHTNSFGIMTVVKHT